MCGAAVGPSDDNDVTGATQGFPDYAYSQHGLAVGECLVLHDFKMWVSSSFVLATTLHYLLLSAEEVDGNYTDSVPGNNFQRFGVDQIRKYSMNNTVSNMQATYT